MIIESVFRTLKKDGFRTVARKSANHIFRGGEDIVDYAYFDYRKRQAPQAVFEGLTSDDLSLSDEEHPLFAIQIHVYFIDLLGEIIQTVNTMPYPYDVFVSTDTAEKKTIIETEMARSCSAHSVEVGVYNNQGRDIAPFIQQMAPAIDRYQYICHLHTKKSETVDFGDSWRHYLYKNLFGSKEYMRALFAQFSADPHLGLITPEIYPMVRRFSDWNGTKQATHELLKRMGCDIPLATVPVFPAGSMFWARTDAVKPIFHLGLTDSDFPEEAGQVNFTLAHVIERIWIYLAQSAGYSYKLLMNEIPQYIPASTARRITLFVHYDKDNILSEQDRYLLQSLKSLSTELIVISHSQLSGETMDSLRTIADEVFTRPNDGMDFAAWRFAMEKVGYDHLAEFDECVLANNSCIGPVRSLDAIFSRMERSDSDFWGITLFPEKEITIEKPTIAHSVQTGISGVKEGSYEADADFLQEVGKTPEHIQSYFIVFNRNVVDSNAFRSFWEDYESTSSFSRTVITGETALTKHLSVAGFSYSAAIPESVDAIACWDTEQPQYHCLFEYLVLGSPFLKKKGAKEMRADRKAATIRYLEQINAPETCIDFFRK